MSPSNINSFVGDLVQMAQAVEQLPKVEQELEQTKGKLDDALITVQDRELAITRYKSEIEELNAKVRSLEVERDDASFRVLEAEDREHVALNMARSIASAVGNVINTLDPPKPEPVKELEPVATPAEGQSGTDPTIHGTAVSSNSQDQTSVNDIAIQSESASTSTTIPDWKQDQAETSLMRPLHEAVHSISETGQSEGHPTVAIGQVEKDANLSPATPTDAGSTTSEASPASPYYGKRYHDMPHYISYYDWLSGGGTEEDYNWRPTRPIASGSY